MAAALNPVTWPVTEATRIEERRARLDCMATDPRGGASPTSSTTAGDAATSVSGASTHPAFAPLIRARADTPGNGQPSTVELVRLRRDQRVDLPIQAIFKFLDKIRA